MYGMMSVKPGGPETLERLDMPTPEPDPHQVLIRVHAAGVNFPDTLIIRDLYQQKPARPFAPGGEIAGVIEAVGSEITTFNIGDRVLSVGFHGGYVSHLATDPVNVHRIPDTMSFEEAAAFMFTYGTSHYALTDRAGLQKEETLLVLGAAGGVGSAAIELGKAMKARVIAAVSSEEKAAFCRSIGADETIIYPRTMDREAQKAFGQSIKEAAGKSGVDVVYDAVGGNYSEPALRSLAWNGRFLVVGFPAGIPAIPLNLTLLKSCQIIGVFWGNFMSRDPVRHSDHVRELMALFELGEIAPRISQTYPLEEAGQALRDLEDRKVQGKVVLTVA
ncbi:MAG: NADPH:quinone oxidoreductase family protein [Pseudomonadota bacterium]